MNRAHVLSAALVAALAAACSTAPRTTISEAPVVGVTATTPATAPTLSSGLNTQTTTERVVIGEPAAITARDEEARKKAQVVGGAPR